MRSNDYNCTNAKLLVDDCVYYLYEGKELSLSEADDVIEMFNIVLAYCKEHGVVKDYNIDVFEDIVCKLSEEYREEYYGDDEESED